MRTLNIQEQDSVAGGVEWGQLLVGGGAIWAPLQIAGGPAIVNGTVTGVVGPSAGVAGGTVVGVGLVPVALGVAVATGGALVGNAIGNSAPVQSAADAVGTWLGEHGIVW